MVTARDVERLLTRIQSIRRTPARQLQLETKMRRELATFFREIGKDTAEYIQSLGRVPARDDPALHPLSEFFKKKTKEYQVILGKYVFTAFLMGRERVSPKKKGKAHKAYQWNPEFDDEYAALWPVFDGLLEPNIAQFLINKFFTASERTMARVEGDVMANLAMSYMDGVGNYDAAMNLNEVMRDMALYETERIARTEINSAQNYGAFLQLESAGVTEVMWITALDDRVRGLNPKDAADHVSMHGEITRLGEPFSNGLLFPGDRDGPIEEWINCRCQIVPA